MFLLLAAACGLACGAGYGILLVGLIAAGSAVALFVWNRGAFAAVALIVILNGVPGFDLSGFAGGTIKYQDIAICVLFLVLASRFERAPNQQWAQMRRLAYLWSAAMVSIWLITFVRSLTQGIPGLSAALFGRDFLYFALLLPLACSVRLVRTEVVGFVAVALAGCAVFAVGDVLTALGLGGHALVNGKRFTDASGIVRVYSPMEDLVALVACLSFAATFASADARLRRYAGVLMILTGASLAVELTRAYYAGLACGLILATAWWLGRTRSTHLRRRITFFVLAGGAGAILLFIALPGVAESAGHSGVISRLGSTVTTVLNGSGTLSYRYHVEHNMEVLLGSNWPLGLGFLHPTAHPVWILPGGTIRNSDLGVFNSLMTMGVVGSVLLYLPLLYLLVRAMRSSFGSVPRNSWIAYGGSIWIVAVLASSATLIVLFSPNGLVLTALALAALARVLFASVDYPRDRIIARSNRGDLALRRRYVTDNGDKREGQHARGVSDEQVGEYGRFRPETDDMSGRGSQKFTSRNGDTTIVVVSYQSAHQMEGFLDAALRAAPSAEVVIVDNASSDSTVALSAAYPRVEVIPLETNIGFGRAANVGARVARGEWLVFANPDVRLRSVELPTGTLGDKFGLGAGVLEEIAGDPRSGVRSNFIFRGWEQEVFGRLLPPRAASSLLRPQASAGTWVSGALFATAKETFHGVGGFDERYFMYFEDRDLGARYQRLGIPIRTLPGLVGDHEVGGSSATEAPDMRRHAWSLMSWIEYIGIWDGQEAADATAARAFQVFASVARAGAYTPNWRRLRAKAEEVSDLIEVCTAVATDGSPEMNSYYPHARQAIRRAASRRLTHRS